MSAAFGQIRTHVSLKELDSLIRKTNDLKGIQQVDHLNLLATSISQRYPDSCLYYARQALKLSKSLGYKFGEAEAVFNTGNGYFFKIDVKMATVNYLVALRMFEKLKPSVELGNLLLQIGLINAYIQNHTKAIEYHRKSGRVFENLELCHEQHNAIYQQAHEYVDAKMYDSAFYYFKKIIRFCKKSNNKKLLSRAYNGCGITHLWRDDYRPENERFEGEFAIPYFDSALLTANETNYHIFNPDMLTNLAECYHHYMNPPKRTVAEKIYMKAIAAGYQERDYAAIASAQALLGELYADENKQYQAKVYLDSSLISIKKYYSVVDTFVYTESYRKYAELSYMHWTKSFTYRGYYKLFRAQGDLDSAIYYYQFMVKIIDSLKDQQNRQQIDYILANFESEEISRQLELLTKEKELQESRAQRTLLFLVGTGILLILIIIIAILYLRQNKLRAEQEKTNLQQKLLRSQMNPHFIFNSLASIQNSIINDDPLKASKYLSRFSKLFRNILESSNEELIPLEEEIKTIENYLELQKIRFPEKFDYTIKTDERLDPENIRVPPMIAQPFIENAIEHGIKHLDSKGNVSVRFRMQNDMIELSVEDDGIGRKKAQDIRNMQDPSHRSLATAITMDRIRVLNKKLKNKITFTIKDLKNETGEATGTMVVMEIPVIN